MSFADEDRFEYAPEVLSRILEGEAVLLDLESGRYLGLNEVAAFAWERLGEGATVAQLLEAIVLEFDVTEDVARIDLQALLQDLVERGLARQAPKISS